MRTQAAILIIIGIYIQSCYKEETLFDTLPDESLEMPVLLKIAGKDCCYDVESNSLRYPIATDSVINFSPFIEFQDYSTVYFNDLLLKNKSENQLGTIKIGVEYEISFIVAGKETLMTLVFTNLPVIRINTRGQIYDEPEIVAKITVNYPETDKEPFSSFIKIEQRGYTALNFPKKSYGFDFIEQSNPNNEVSQSLFGLKSNKNWILDAAYNDPARMRNRVSFELWSRFTGDRHYAIHPKFVELFINNEHQGLYCLSEQMNAEHLDMNNPEALIYFAKVWADGATQFQTLEGVPTDYYYWDGWEQKYPDPKEKINWEPLYNLRELVVRGNEVEFVSGIGNLIDIDSFIDYYILINLLSAVDNTGKNMILARWNNDEKLSVIPWDLEASWGILWDAERIFYTGIVSNHLYDRLLDINPANYRNNLKNRWFYLRETVIIPSLIQNLFHINYIDLSKSGIINIENEIWGLSICLESEQVYIDDWTVQRIEYLDIYFSEL
jgi:hypothetical protein